MTTPDILVLNTASSRFFGPDGHPAIDAFKRVVGIEYGGEELWSEISSTIDSTGGYDREQTTPLELAVPEWFAERTRDYFQAYLVLPDEESAHNCHSFARYVVSRGKPVRPDLDVVRRGTKGVYPLEAGQRGVVGVNTGASIRAPHAFVGLGRERKDCLQVMSYGGFMGVTSYESVLGYYRHNRSNKNEVDIYTEPTTPQEQSVDV